MIPVSKNEQSINELLDVYGDDINIHILYIFIYAVHYIYYNNHYKPTNSSTTFIKTMPRHI